MKINWDYKVEEGAITENRMMVAFAIAIVLFSVIIWPGILLNIPMTVGAKYVWGACSALMFYLCFLKKGASNTKNLIGIIMTIALGPLAVITIGIVYLIRRRNLSGVSNRCINKPCGTDRHHLDP
jgi:hypothetical protein